MAIVTGGGSGHLPLFLGYVGHGLADGVAVGNVFSSPSADQILEVAKATDAGRGVLFLFGNYGGDVMNFGIAAELAEAEGISVATVTATDDIASAPKGEEQRRRGIAGLFFLYKVAGARAEEGAALDEIKMVTERAAANLRSMGVALSSCVIPAVGHPTFDVAPGEMELGMGIHGEPGVRRGPSSLRMTSPTISWMRSWLTWATARETSSTCSSMGWVLRLLRSYIYCAAAHVLV